MTRRLRLLGWVVVTGLSVLFVVLYLHNFGDRIADLEGDLHDAEIRAEENAASAQRLADQVDRLGGDPVVEPPTTPTATGAARSGRPRRPAGLPRVDHLHRLLRPHLHLHRPRRRPELLLPGDDPVTELLIVLRALNVALAIFAAAGLLMRLNDDWGHLQPGRRLLYTGGVMFPIVAAYASAENYVQGGPVGARIPLTTAACLVVHVGLWRVQRAEHKRRRAER